MKSTMHLICAFENVRHAYIFGKDCCYDIRFDATAPPRHAACHMLVSVLSATQSLCFFHLTQCTWTYECAH